MTARALAGVAGKTGGIPGIGVLHLSTSEYVAGLLVGVVLAVWLLFSGKSGFTKTLRHLGFSVIIGGAVGIGVISWAENRRHSFLVTRAATAHMSVTELVMFGWLGSALAASVLAFLAFRAGGRRRSPARAQFRAW